MTDLLPIGAAARRVGASESALRYYDDLGLVPATTRIAGQRRYDERAVRRLRIVALCQRAGFTLAETRQLLDADGDWRDLATRKLAELEQRIAGLHEAKRLVTAALDCDCAHLEGCEATDHRAPEAICGARPRTKETT